MAYSIENYKNCERFNEQCGEIRRFLQKFSDIGHNEHFHYGRFEWMMSSGYLDREKLQKIALFRDASGKLVGLALFDTGFQDRWYLLHSVSEDELLRQIIGYVTDMEDKTAVIKVNSKDAKLLAALDDIGFAKQNAESVLEIDALHDLSYRLPDGFDLNSRDAKIDDAQWELVTWRGFDHEGEPEEPDDEVAEAEKRLEKSDYIKVFALKDGGYAAHCGIWYCGGETAYIEPVVTVPEHRGKGLGRAVVYEAVRRAGERGAKRAVVLSDQEFYLRIGMKKSSEVGTWTFK